MMRADHRSHEKHAENEFIPQYCAIFATITRHVDLLVFCSC